MSRKRFVTSEISKDRKLAFVAEDSPSAALMWPWFMTALDDWGRMAADPMEVKLELFPAFTFSVRDVDAAIRLYDKHGLAHHYTVDGKPYLAVNPKTWYKYQTYIKADRKSNQSSRFPAPPAPPWGEYVPEPKTQPDQQTSATEAEDEEESAIIADNPQQSAENVPSLSPSPPPSPSRDLRSSSASDDDDDDAPAEGQGEEKKPKYAPSEDSPEFELALYLRSRILDNKPDAKVPKSTPEGLAAWSQCLDRMIRLDKRSPDEIRAVIDWCQASEFWRSNILSANKLRDKWDTLTMQMERPKPRGKPPARTSSIRNTVGEEDPLDDIRLYRALPPKDAGGGG